MLDSCQAGDVRIPTSATLAVNDLVAARRARGDTVLHLGFGEAGLPVLPQLREVLADAAADNRYGPSAGSLSARAAAAGWFTRRGRATTADQVILGPGSKPLLLAFVAALGGDVVLPQPAWVSYAAQAALLGREAIGVPVPDEAGGIPDPELLEDAVRVARSRGLRPAVLVLTVPDNPTGTFASADLLSRVCAVADHHGLAVICDEIYADLAFTGSSPSAATYLPDRTVVTTGLSKSLALGGWRIGFARIPDNAWGHALMERTVGIASETWSSLAAPMQQVMTYALGDPPDVTSFVDSARRLHARVATAVHACLLEAEARCRAPQAGFYLYPDFEPARERLASRGIHSSADLTHVLLDRHGIAALPGAAFGDDPAALRLRLATSLMYGDTAQQRQEALAADRPETLPWIADALDLIHTQLAALVGR